MVFNLRQDPVCDKHLGRYGHYKRIDKHGKTIHMCEDCRIRFALDVEILVCKHCGVIVKSEEDTRAKFPEFAPHTPECERYIPPPKAPVFEDFDFYENHRRR